jgi:hypothetical protein
MRDRRLLKEKHEPYMYRTFNLNPYAAHSVRSTNYCNSAIEPKSASNRRL